MPSRTQKQRLLNMKPRDGSFGVGVVPPHGDLFWCLLAAPRVEAVPLHGGLFWHLLAAPRMEVALQRPLLLKTNQHVFLLPS